MIEYSYIDRNFLEVHRAKQNSGIRTPFDWKLSLSILGQQASFNKPSDFKDFDRLVGEVEKLKGRRFTAKNRLGDPFSRKQSQLYFEERIEASYGVYKSKELVALGIPHLKFWISDDQRFVLDKARNTRSGFVRLLLIEGPLDQRGEPWLMSGYSALSLVFDILSSDIPENPGSNKHSRVVGSDHSSGDLRQALSLLGVVFSKKQEVEVLYRVRASCMEAAYNFVVGYPISIARHI